MKKFIYTAEEGARAVKKYQENFIHGSIMRNVFKIIRAESKKVLKIIFFILIHLVLPIMFLKNWKNWAINCTSMTLPNMCPSILYGYLGGKRSFDRFASRAANSQFVYI